MAGDSAQRLSGESGLLPYKTCIARHVETFQPNGRKCEPAMFPAWLRDDWRLDLHGKLVKHWAPPQPCLLPPNVIVEHG